jgi:formamidopyrimidine-DNA glycosylase
MPELPEVETIRRGLQKELCGSTIKSIKVLRPESVAYPAGNDFVNSLKGRTFRSFDRRGKYLLINMSEGTCLVVHLRMSGRLLVLAPSAREPAHVRVRLNLADGRKLIFDDTRVFGRLWFVAAGESRKSVVPALAELGPEPLEGLKPADLRVAFAGKTQPIKSALLDQTIIAGIGNIYADESLHLAGIRPQRPAGDLSAAELTRLANRIADVLHSAIEAGGSTLRDYTGATGVNGNYQHEAFVYGRKGEPCRKCKSRIERIKLAGRSTHYCPRCQR